MHSKTEPIQEHLAKDSLVSPKNIQLVQLEDIPFTMPIDWVYHRRPFPFMPSLVGQASNPTEPQTVLSISDYEVDTIEELMSLLIEDQKQLNLQHSYRLKDDFILTTTRYGEQIFLGQGLYGKVNNKLRLICITTYKEMYDDRLPLIETILASVTFD
ncbi:MAG: hypothetical protein AAGB24_06185 [Bacteroidota bacterium]